MGQPPPPAGEAAMGTQAGRTGSSVYGGGAYFQHFREPGRQLYRLGEGHGEELALRQLVLDPHSPFGDVLDDELLGVLAARLPAGSPRQPVAAVHAEAPDALHAAEWRWPQARDQLRWLAGWPRGRVAAEQGRWVHADAGHAGRCSVSRQAPRARTDPAGAAPTESRRAL